MGISNLISHRSFFKLTRKGGGEGYTGKMGFSPIFLTFIAPEITNLAENRRQKEHPIFNQFR